MPAGALERGRFQGQDLDHPGRAHEDATALALTWSIFLVSQHRETEQRILNEIELHAGGRPIGADVAGNLAFTRQVIQEAMRLYPPVY
jgi:cytochrome P450